MSKKISGQIWVETVVYMLIGLAIIGILLGIIKPVIEKKQDQILIEQSLSLLNNIESEVESVVYYGPGNSRTIEIKIRKGKLEIGSNNDNIKFSTESKYMYSEPGQPIEVGNIDVLTTKKIKTYDVELTLNYADNLNLTWNDRDVRHTFQKAPIPYKLVVTNMGKTNGLLQVDFK